MSELHAVVSTHTTLHLRRTLLGLCTQTRIPDSIIVSCDNDDPAIAAVVKSAAAEFAREISIAARARPPICRVSQVRNNGVRVLVDHRTPDDALVVLIDGDSFLVPNALERHEQLAKRAQIVVGFRIDLTPEQTEAFDESRVGRGEWPVDVTPAQIFGLALRHKRYRRHALLRRLGLAKAHKPKILSANHAVRLGLFRAINGYDEGYEGYGQEDDDFGRRAYRAGARPAIAVARAIALHLYHPTRAPGHWSDAPGIERFRSVRQTRAALGLDSPAPQGPITVTRFGA